MTTTSVGFKAARYRIDSEIGRGNMGTVYRAYDRMTGQLVALKEVKTQDGTVKFNSADTAEAAQEMRDMRLSLAREFRTLASMRHPNIISVLDYGFDEGQPYFTMELLEDADTLFTATRDKTWEQKIYYAAQILHALVYMHRRGIVHRDLKPENVMVVDGHVKVLDFGLAMEKRSTDEAPAGTLAYMAPEVLTGSPASFSSDLYAVGMMTYEMLAGEHPFDTDDLAHLLRQMMQEVPDIEMLDIDVELSEAIEKMLAKEPADRYHDARSVLQIFDEATDLSLQSEETSIRESFLQAADFIGREEQLAKLSQALVDAKNHKGSAWLIGGESGVGKSRLLDEIRTQALVQGMVVLRGQSVQEASAPYTVWRNPLRALALWTKVKPDEAQIISPLVPDIGDLLNLDVQESDTVHSRDRLYSVTEGLFARHKQPTLLILEDLQWSTESIGLLHHMLHFIDDWPLVVMGSYRDEEAPDLPFALNRMNLMKLDRLSDPQIEELSVSMLGEDVGRNPEIVKLLSAETEGNVLFIIEVVRTLAERAGSLDNIASQTLPEEVFSGSIQMIVQRRIESLPEYMLELLQMAAIAGRRLDVTMLNHMNPHNFSLNRWLVVCSDAAVIEIQDDQWRFSHDKIRTALISMLDDERKEIIHRKVATTLEAMSEKGSGYRQYARIAYHWEKGNAYEMALPHLTQAAEEALRDYASSHVVDYLEQALVLNQKLKEDDESSGATNEVRAHWQRLLGEAMDMDGNQDAAKQHYQSLLNILDPDGTGTSISNYSKLDNKNKSKDITPEQEDALFACNRLLNLYLYNGEWDHAEKIITQMGTIYFGIGDQRSWIGTLVTTAWIDYFQGNFNGAEKGFTQSFTIGRLRKLPTMLIAGGAGLVMVNLRHGNSDEQIQKVMNDLDHAIEGLDKEIENRERILLNGTRGVVYVAMKQFAKAAALAREGLSLISITRDFELFDLVAYTSVAESLLELWESGYNDEELKYDVQNATGSLHSFAQLVPIARPRAWIFQARGNWLNGEHKRAKRALNTAILEAQNLHMPYDEGIAYYHLGRLSREDKSDASGYLQAAINLLEGVGAIEQIRKARAILESMSEDETSEDETSEDETSQDEASKDETSQNETSEDETTS